MHNAPHRVSRILGRWLATLLLLQHQLAMFLVQTGREAAGVHQPLAFFLNCMRLMVTGASRMCSKGGSSKAILESSASLSMVRSSCFEWLRSLSFELCSICRNKFGKLTVDSREVVVASEELVMHCEEFLAIKYYTSVL